MKRQNLTHTLPATRVTAEMRKRTEAVAKAIGCDIADVVRDTLSTSLVHMELQLSLTTIDDYDDEELEAVGLGQAVEKKQIKREMDTEMMTEAERRTRGLAWGPPLPEEPAVR